MSSSAYSKFKKPGKVRWIDKSSYYTRSVGGVHERVRGTPWAKRVQKGKLSRSLQKVYRDAKNTTGYGMFGRDHATGWARQPVVLTPRFVEKKTVDFYEGPTTNNQGVVDPTVAANDAFRVGYATNAPIPYYGALLNGSVQGASFFNRVGNYVANRSLHIEVRLRRVNGSLLVPLPASPPMTFVRCLVVYDRQPNGGTQPLLSSVLQEVSAAGATSTSAQSGSNLLTTGRYLPLWDEHVIWNHVSPFEILVSNSYMKKHIRLGNLPTVYSGSGAPPFESYMYTGAIWLYIFQLIEGPIPWDQTQPSLYAQVRARWTFIDSYGQSERDPYNEYR